MTEVGFFAVPADEDIVGEVSALLPENPFATWSFFHARRKLGYEAWILGERGDSDRLDLACGAFLKGGRLNRNLEIPSAPKAELGGRFWQGVHAFCRHRKVTVVEIGTFGSPPDTTVPQLGRVCSRRDRCEYVLDLATDPTVSLGSNHKRNLKRAQKAGVIIHRSNSTEKLSAHRELMRRSLERRNSRGEEIEIMEDSPDALAFLESSAAEIFQAVRGDSVLSSVLVLRAPQGGYYQSAGTSADGMAIGASHFLIHGIASQLRAEGLKTFNLGGAEEGSSLARFKEGFGAKPRPLAAANCYVGPAWRRLLTQGFHRAQRMPYIASSLRRRVSTLKIYAANPVDIPLPEESASLVLQVMTADDLRALSTSDESFRKRQLDRLERFGASYAYAVIMDGELAHISWLLPPAAMQKDFPRVIRASAGRAEITCCETLSGYRGRGIYTFAIRSLAGIARSQGIRRIYMKTSLDNRSSQIGIEKAGLVRKGRSWLIEEPLTKRILIWRRF